MEISNIVNRVLLRYPLFGNIIVNLNFKFTDASVSAPAFTDGSTIYYKEEFLTEYTDDEKEFIIAHEVFHICLSHIFRNVGKDEDLLNYVEDAIINQLLIRDGLVMPQNAVYVEDALDYSADELYMKYLWKLDQIKKWMAANTYHMGIGSVNDLSEKINEILENSYNKDLQELMADNRQIREDLLNDYKSKLKREAQTSGLAGWGDFTASQEFPSVPVGEAKPLVSWMDLLESNLTFDESFSTSFYEVQMDGIIKKEGKPELDYSESEIIIDSSGSMDMNKIKAVLRECKNILSVSHIKVGFCDVEFYGWKEIRTYNDIDNLKIVGRGGTDFIKMAESFSPGVDNKIVITDGWCKFPNDHPEILWLVINYYLPFTLDPSRSKHYGIDNLDNINYIFINEKDIPVPSKKLVLDKKINSSY